MAIHNIAGLIRTHGAERANPAPTFTRFVYRPHWFALSQTEGCDYVPMALPEWEEARARHKVEGWTIDISPKGCLAVVPQGFPVGQKLDLINLVNKNVSKAILIWRGHEGRSGWELGLELVDVPEDFWGLDF